MKRRVVPKISGLIYGGDYNPEQWPEQVWHEDMALMKKAGVNLVTICVFAWSRIEPRPGEYDFDWVHRLMDLLAENGIFACLANATASPPHWMARLYPESLPVDAEGRVYYPGSRQHYSVTSRDYRRHVAALTREFARRFAGHPALAVWHVNNEYACHMPYCMSENTAAAFRAWLRERYGTLDALNEAWGTTFWSQIISDWEEILPPRKAPTQLNPALQLDYHRFIHQATLECYLAEKEILQAATPDIPITTNFVGLMKSLDYMEWGRHVDFVAWDSYPDPNGGLDESVLNALAHSWMRGCGRGQPWVLMEQVTSQVNWRPVNSLKPPGMMRLHSYQALAHGADGIMFFQWRASRFGGEKFHGAMVPHVGPERSRIFREVCELGQELKTLAVLQGSTVDSSVALMMDAQNRWALELGSKPSNRLNGVTEPLHFFRALWQNAIPVEIVGTDHDLSRYRVLVVPTLYLMTQATAQRLRDYVQAGGTLIVSYFSGIVNEHEQIQLGGYPAMLRDVLGLWVEEWQPLPEGVQKTLRLNATGQILRAHTWCDLLHVEGAEVLATYTSDFFAGRPALTRHRFGQGWAYYVATKLEPVDLESWLLNTLAEAGVHPLIPPQEGIEATLRMDQDHRYLFILNHLDQAREVELGTWRGVDLLHGHPVVSKLALPPFGAAVVRLDTLPSP